MANTSKNKSIRVGVLVSGALFVLMLFVFFIGSEQKIFARKNEYEVRLENVTGLSQGNPVRMSGVTIGTIRALIAYRLTTAHMVERGAETRCVSRSTM